MIALILLVTTVCFFLTPIYSPEASHATSISEEDRETYSSWQHSGTNPARPNQKSPEVLSTTSIFAEKMALPPAQKDLEEESIVDSQSKEETKPIAPEETQPDKKLKILSDFTDAEAPPNRTMIVSKMTTTADFLEPWMGHYLALMGDTAHRRHRKQWELAYTAYIMAELGICPSLAPNQPRKPRGLVFAAGKEVLISYFINAGCDIVATDMDLARAKKVV